jgi:hypothetical protein
MTCCDPKLPTIQGALGACVPGALPGGLARTRFFDGMVLTQADLENEQRYWRMKRRLTNRALGAGVVWGLRLRWDARRRLFVLAPGYALDCCGNDLIVECPIEIGEADLIARADPSLRGGGKVVVGGEVGLAQAGPRTACVVLQHVECPEDARPVHLDPCTPPTSRCEPSRVRETSRLLLVPPPMAPPPDCQDGWFDDLEDVKASITDPVLRDQLFPPPPPPPTAGFPEPGSMLPATLRVAIPGTGAVSEATLQPPANGTAAGPPLAATHPIPPSGLRSGVVQLELRPSPDWGFFQGEVKQGDPGGVTVDVVAPPLDLQQFWSIEMVLPSGATEVTQPFKYNVVQLGLEEMFADHATGLSDLVITGTLIVREGQNGEIETLVDALQVVSTSTVGQHASEPGCLDGLIPWGFMADLDRAEDKAKLLLLAAMYAYFSDLTARSGGTWTPQRVAAAKSYIAAWKLLGVDLDVPNAEAQKLELARILGRLLQCWCDAMLYPGPRCTSEHHGVTLGCATIGPTGQILSFDMWEHRRHVLTGPLVGHSLGVLGVAPLDVIVARLAQSICCLSGLPLPAQTNPPPEDPPAPGVSIGRGTLFVQFTQSAEPAREAGVGEIVRRMIGALIADSAAPLARFRTRLDNGAFLELLAPAEEEEEPPQVLRAETDAALARSVPPLRPLAAAAARAAIAELAREIPPAAVPGLTGAAAELAKVLGARGLTLAGLVEAGAEGLIAAHPSSDPAAIDELAARAGAALAALVESVAAGARKAAPARPSAILRDAAVRAAVTDELGRRFGALPAPKLEAALERAAVRAR